MNAGLNPEFYSPVRANKTADHDAPNETLDYKNICSAFDAERTARPSDADLIIQAVGLKPLSLFSSLAEVKQRLGIANQPEDVMLSPDHIWHAQKIGKNPKTSDATPGP